MQIQPAQRRYWRKNLTLTSALLLAWFVITFVGGYYAATLNEISFLGFPLGFYLLAQGALLAYLIIIGIYVRTMNRLDREWELEAAHHDAATAAGARND
jgi:putative solute:sodium symporter small subunit